MTDEKIISSDEQLKEEQLNDEQLDAIAGGSLARLRERITRRNDW